MSSAGRSSTVSPARRRVSDVARTPRKERRYRGRLSRLDTLPEVAQPDLVWLNHELRENKRPANELLDVFNMRLAAHGIEPISNGSFSRYSVRKATQFHELDQAHRLSRDVADFLGHDSADKMTVAVAELLKVRAYEKIETGELEPLDFMSLGRALKDVVAAQKQSLEYRQKLAAEHKRKVEEAQKDVAAIGKQHGVSDEAMRKITQRLAGIA
jgi:hypothetical protein